MSFKILIDGRLLSKRATGISRYTEEVILSYYSIYGKENIWILINDPIWSSKYSNTILTKYKPFNLFHFYLFSRFLKKVNYHIYHSTFYSGTYTNLLGKLSILTVHDLMYKVLPDFFSNNVLINKVAQLYYNFIVDRSISNASLIFSVSRTTANDINEIFKRESKVIPEGINLINLTEETSLFDLDVLDKIGVKPKEYYFYVGNLRKHKNIKFMIDCFIKSKSAKTLVIAGSHPDSVISELGINNKVKFIGYVTDKELTSLYRNCLAFVFPSIYEGFGLPILEALNNGACVISSRGGALKEFSDSVINFFDPFEEDSLIELFDKGEFTYNKELVEEELKKYDWTANLKIMHYEISQLTKNFNKYT